MSGPTRDRSRLAGLDAARGVAVLGMFAAHTIAVSEPTGVFAVLEELAGGTRPRMLFALVGGISLGLLVGSTLRGGHTGGGWFARLGDRRAIRLQVAIRGILLLALGLLLHTFFSGVSVVIDEWGLLFLLMLPLLFVPSRWLLAGALVLMVAGHVAIAAGVGQAEPGLSLQSELGLADEARERAFSWLFTGSYPLVTWLPSIVGGVLLARAGLGRARTQAGMAIVGGAVVVIGLLLAPLLDPEAEIGPPDWPATLAEQLSALGCAALVVAALIWATSARLGAAGRVIARILHPLSAAGAMPLTVYTAHVLALGAWYWLDPAGWRPDATTWALLTAITLIMCPLWRWAIGQGPLEWLLAWASGRRVR